MMWIRQLTVFAFVVTGANAQTISQATETKQTDSAIDATMLSQIRGASRALLAAKASQVNDPDVQKMELELKELRESLKATLDNTLLHSTGEGVEIRRSDISDEEERNELLRKKLLKIKELRMGMRAKLKSAEKHANSNLLRKSELIQHFETVEKNVVEAMALPSATRAERIREQIEKLRPRTQEEIIYKQRAEMARRHPEQAQFWLSEKVSPTFNFAVIGEKN